MAEPDTMPELPEARVDERSRVSLVWFIPLVALIAAAWLGYRAYQDHGPLITISFETAEGLEAGKTRLRYKDVAVGLVEAIDLSPDLSRVQVHARLRASLSDYLVDQTRFWVVRPRLSGGQISGLETLLGGTYIGVDLSREGLATRAFTGLEAPPVVSATQSGRRFTLQAARLGSLAIGAPVRYRGIEVGRVSGYDLNASGGVDVQVFVDAPYDQQVNAETRFWNDSGFQLIVDAEGARVATESLTSLLLGGVSFANREGTDAAPAVADEHRFTLFDDLATAMAPAPGHRQVWELDFAGTVRGLLPGAPVEFRGIRIGEVEDVRLEIGDAGDTRIPVRIAIEPALLGLPQDAVDPAHQAFWDELVAAGLRAQLKTANLVSGALYVDLDYYPDDGPRAIAWTSDPPMMPTVPTTLDELRSVLSSIARLPLDQMGEDLGNSLESLSETMRATNTLLGRLDSETTSELNRTLAQTRATLESADALLSPNSPLQTEAYRALREFGAAARSFRLMADYLERHPEALIRGKTGEQK
jgi:paraquat-inducible protein B